MSISTGIQILWTSTMLVPMNIEEKNRLARRGDMDILASAIRLKASRLAAGFGDGQEQKRFAAAAEVSSTSYNNMERAKQFPNRKIMQYLFLAHRIDFNFLFAGEFSQLPSDVQERIFEHLPTVNSEWAKTPSSD